MMMTDIFEKNQLLPGIDSDREELSGNLDTGFLKLLAMVLMIIDHLGASVFKNINELRIIGRMALPLYAWCLVVGCVKTKNPLRYCLRLLLCAVISQPVYMLALNHEWQDLNILFLLFLAAAMIWGIRANFYGSRIWAPLLCFLVLGFLDIDYGWRGLMFILLMYLARKSRSGLVAFYLAYALFWGKDYSVISSVFGINLPFFQIPGIGTVLQGFFRMQGMIWLSLPLIALKTNTGFHMPKVLGYVIYPGHLVLLVLFKLLMGFSWNSMISGF